MPRKKPPVALADMDNVTFLRSRIEHCAKRIDEATGSKAWQAVASLERQLAKYKVELNKSEEQEAQRRELETNEDDLVADILCFPDDVLADQRIVNRVDDVRQDGK